MPKGIKGFQKGNTVNKGRIPHNKGGSSWAKGKKFSEVHRKKIGDSHRGDKYYNWKLNPSYDTLHAWLFYTFGKANKCENKNCVTLNPKRYEWSKLKNKEYERKRENYWMLCINCHHKYDNLGLNFTRKNI